MFKIESVLAVVDLYKPWNKVIETYNIPVDANIQKKGVRFYDEIQAIRLAKRCGKIRLDRICLIRLRGCKQVAETFLSATWNLIIEERGREFSAAIAGGAAPTGSKIVAAELDYVGDVVIPLELFGPVLPVSVACTVRRFPGSQNTRWPAMTAIEFVERILPL